MPALTNNPSSVALLKESVVHQIPVAHRSLRLSSLGLLLCVLVGWGGVVPTAARAAEDPCPNAALRALNNSSGLPDCRAYEMVTSPYKEGFGLFQQTYSDDGAFAYWSIGNFVDNPFGSTNGNQYVATRSAAGWKSVSHNPPGDQWVFWPTQGAENGLSSDLRSSVWMMHPYARGGAPDDIYVRRPDGGFSFIGPNPGAALPSVYAASADLSHLMVSGQRDTLPLPNNVYEYTDGDHAPVPIQVDNSGVPLAQIDVRCGKGMSDDGRVILFGLDYQSCNSRLWARVGAATTINLAASECTRTATDPGGECNGSAAVNLGGSALDGSRVVFTTTQQLVDGDTDTSNDLYACDIPPGPVVRVGLVNDCPHLRQVSGAASGADVQNVARVADDGSRVYFIARGVLADNQGANGLGALAGADNLYVWQQDAEHPAGHTTFMARLQTDGRPGYETTPDGRYLLLTTPTPLVTSGPTADTDSAADVYRYDAETETWLRISTDTTGSGGNAEIAARNGSNTRPKERPRTSMTADGRIVVFYSDEALAPPDANSVADVYAWQEGQVSLISADGGGNPQITASGTDIFFETTNHVTAADGDTNSDVYDARVGGGFDLRDPAPCEGEGCRGARSAPPGPRPGTGGLGGQGDVQVPAPRFTLRALSAAQRRVLAATGRVTVRVTTNAPGTVRVRAEEAASGRDDGKLSIFAMARDVLALAGSVQLTLRLSKKARERLATRRRLALRIVASHSNVALTQSTTLTLKTKTKAKAKVKKVAKRSSDRQDTDGKGRRS